MVAALTRVFGIHNLALAEDVVQDAFCRALEVWKFRGVPDNPSAWLMATAKHRAIDVLRRERTARTFAPELGRLLESEWTLVPLVEELFGPLAVKDDLLRMMFSCCHPRLAEEAQVALVLHILCGFGDQRGRRRVSRHARPRSRSASRARRKCSPGRSDCSIWRTPTFRAGCPPCIARCICSSTRAITARPRNRRCRSSCAAKRSGWRRCCSSIRAPRRRRRYALAALMSLHAARLPARVERSRAICSRCFDQDRSRWDRELIEEGQRLLELSATGPR